MKSFIYGAMTAGFMAVSLFADSTAAAWNDAPATWDLSKKNNFMLYWGQNAHGSYNATDNKQQQRLIEYCKDTAVDLISIGFLHSHKPSTLWTLPEDQPIVNFSNQCGRTFPDSPLLYCPEISEDIIACQKLGKKILLSIGGSAGNYAGFATPIRGMAFGDKLWDMFGKGWDYYRPFGKAVLDGFDFDIEHAGPFYDRTAEQLKSHFAEDPSKEYLLTAAPQCPLPDAYMDTMLTTQHFDAVFVQFYNNPACQASSWTATGTNTFNFGAWHDWVAKSAFNKNMKVFLTLPASQKMGSGYVSKDVAAKIVADVAKKYPSTFGGVGMWDASEAYANTGYVARMRTALDAAEAVAAKAKRSFFGRFARV